MKIEIHDVDHGACVVVTSPTGQRLMIDCGLNRDKPWFPSIQYLGERIDTLMLMNLDEDHVEDFVSIWDRCQIGGIVSNPTVTATALRSMKAEGGMRSGVAHAASILQHFRSGFIGDWSNDLGGISWEAFWNVYGRDFTDTNNLSLATFVSWKGFTILFGGDLECAGWRKLLENPLFRARLPEVKVLVASHHGRENGQCADLFTYFRPELVIFSDGAKQYQTQETNCWYAQRVRGIPDLTKPLSMIGYQSRSVMTTRRDGTVEIEVGADGRYMVYSEPPARSALQDLVGQLLASPPTGFQPNALSGHW